MNLKIDKEVFASGGNVRKFNANLMKCDCCKLV